MSQEVDAPPTFPGGWTVSGAKLTDPRTLVTLRLAIEEATPLIVEHRAYVARTTPRRFVCDDFLALLHHITHDTSAGDHFVIWRYLDCCRPDNVFVDARKPSVLGLVPSGRTY